MVLTSVFMSVGDFSKFSFTESVSKKKRLQIWNL